MNRIIIYDEDQVSDSLFSVKDSFRLQHLTSVLKLEEGKECLVTLLNQGLGRARVYSIKGEEIELEILGELEKGHLQPFKVAIAYSRPPTMKKILEHGTSLGIGEFIFFHSLNSEKSYSQSKVLKEENVQHLLDLGLAQSKVYDSRPKVTQYSGLKDLPLSNDDYVLDFDGESLMHEADSLGIEKLQKSLFLIGPESGWHPNERLYLKEKGLKSKSLHSSTLRVEIALFALLGQLSGYLIK